MCLCVNKSAFSNHVLSGTIAFACLEKHCTPWAGTNNMRSVIEIRLGSVQRVVAGFILKETSGPKIPVSDFF